MIGSLNRVNQQELLLILLPVSLKSVNLFLSHLPWLLLVLQFISSPLHLLPPLQQNKTTLLHSLLSLSWSHLKR